MSRREDFDDAETALQERKRSDEETLNDNENKSDPADVCNSYSWSIVFCFIMAAALIAWIYLSVKMIQKKRTKLTGLDIIFLIVGMCSAIQFGPMLSVSIHAGHKVFEYSQTGCKLMFFTEYGMRNVISLLVSSMYLYAHIGLRHGFESVDRKIQANVGWLVVLVFAFEGLFGIAPAVYVDVSTKESLRTRCIYTQTMTINFQQIISMEIVLRAVTPYILPFVGVVVCEMVTFAHSSSLIQLSRSVNQTTTKSRLLVAILSLTTFFALNLPFAVTVLTEFGLVLRGHHYDRKALCNIKWLLVLLHQVWFLVAPIIFIAKEFDVPMLSAISPLLKNKLRLKMQWAQQDPTNM